jgi:HPt (histidine-containing phosphotransfer) domain-containing protein
MDDYLSKPLRLEELSQMLARWLPQPQPPTAPVAQPVARTEPALPFATWDATTLQRMVGDNPALQRRLLEKFLLNAQVQVTTIGAAAAVGKCAAVADTTHTLKSAARTVGALALGELCQALEHAGRADDGPGCCSLAHDLPLAFAAVSKAIEQYLARP